MKFVILIIGIMWSVIMAIVLPVPYKIEHQLSYTNITVDKKLMQAVKDIKGIEVDGTEYPNLFTVKNLTPLVFKYKVLGIVRGNKNLAVIRDGKRVVFLPEGRYYHGWQLVSIGRNVCIFSSGNTTKAIKVGR